MMKMCVIVKLIMIMINFIKKVNGLNDRNIWVCKYKVTTNKILFSATVTAFSI